MYIKNIDNFGKDKLFSCKKSVADWLVEKNNIPLLAQDGKTYYFAKTDALSVALKKLPLHMKLFSK
jgi:hypothetical protein